ncbi:hypothetical protein EZS27_009698 [termite gut metagenome]|uniref:Uncharacterized protein n=1 Tax=termite gut metagenome TaxID=433724 RepID=A0A5J4SAT5_9ZZZZ
MNSLTTGLPELQRLTHELLCLGTDGSAVYSDTFCRLNEAVFRCSEDLFGLKSANPEEEARLCSALLEGYHATIYDYEGDKEEKIQAVLNRAWKVLDVLPVSAVKCRLLLCCYGEVYEEDLLKEAEEIADSWKSRELSEEEKQVGRELEELRELENGRS